METTEKENKKILKEGRINGTWQLKYKLTNDLGPEGFVGRMLTAYPDALTGKERNRMNVEGQKTIGYWIDKQVILLHPATNPQHALDIDWLVGHPEVGVQIDQTQIDEKYYSRKASNPRATLVNLDHQDIEDLQQEDYIDKLVGLISADTGNKAIGLEKLRWILAKLNHEYREARFIDNPIVEKQQLRKGLKKFVRASYENAVKVNKILDELENAKFAYEIKEMLRLDILNHSGGMFQFHSNPIGTSFEAIIKYFDNNPELYAELQERLYNELK